MHSHPLLSSKSLTFFLGTSSGDIELRAADDQGLFITRAEVGEDVVVGEFADAQLAHTGVRETDAHVPRLRCLGRDLDGPGGCDRLCRR